MIEETKNKNEYRENGNLYVRKIKACVCREKTDDRYTLDCRIQQRGEHEYLFCRADPWITKAYSDRKLWLSGEAEATVHRAVGAFEERTNALMKEREINMEDAGLSVFMGKTAGKLDCVIRYQDGGETVTEWHGKTSLEELLHYLQFLRPLRDSVSKELLQNPTKENIMNHPFILAAKKDGDVQTEKKVKLFYRLADAEDCRLLAKLTGARILPALPEEYDKDYYVDADTLTDRSYALLSRSGYRILHRPYFSMMGSTHTKITLNPHTKMGVDAAKAEADSLSFDEFLGLFDGCEG